LRDIDKTYNLWRLDELEMKLWPDLMWVEFVTKLVLKQTGSVEVPTNETVLIRTPFYFGNLTKLFASTKHR